MTAAIWRRKLDSVESKIIQQGERSELLLERSRLVFELWRAERGLR